MPTAKKKKSTKTAKKTTCRTCCKKSTLSNRERAHVCFVASLSIITGILLCADAAMMIVQ